MAKVVLLTGRTLLALPCSSSSTPPWVKHVGAWSEIDSAGLVQGDMISFKIGDIIPADCRLTDAVTMSIDEAVLMGESLPKSKKSGDFCFSGFICKQGEAKGVMISTSANTFFGHTTSLVG
ncbi:P-type ATPase, partial [Mycena olivaceomarginata]